jgi:hypothetical protein
VLNRWSRGRAHPHRLHECIEALKGGDPCNTGTIGASKPWPHRTRLEPMKKTEGTKAERLRAALRENLRRRKLQAKGRAPSNNTPGDRASAPHDSAEIGTEKQNR